MKFIKNHIYKCSKGNNKYFVIFIYLEELAQTNIHRVFYLYNCNVLIGGVAPKLDKYNGFWTKNKPVKLSVNQLKKYININKIEFRSSEFCQILYETKKARNFKKFELVSI